MQDIVSQLSAGLTANSISGVMIESHLVEGRQNISPDMTYGQSITDACVGWDETVEMLEMLKQGVISRRTLNAS